MNAGAREAISVYVRSGTRASGCAAAKFFFYVLRDLRVFVVKFY
jgi:hypothetical protein